MIKTKYLLLTMVAGAMLTSCAGLKKNSSASSIQDRLSTEDRQKFDYYFYEGLRLKNEGKPDQAMEAFRFCYGLDSIDGGLSFELGNMYAAMKMDSVATGYFEKAYQSNTRNWWYNMQLLSAYAQLNKIDKVTDMAEKMQKTFPNKEEVYDILGSLYKQTGQLQKAINAYDKLELLTGVDERISIEKYGLYHDLKKPVKGMAEIDKLIEKYPSESKYKVLKGDICRSEKQPEEAYAIYQDVVKTDPESPFVYVSLSDYYTDKGETEKANEAIVKALKLDQLGVDQKISILGQYVQKLTQDTARMDETESMFKLLVDRYPLEEQVHGYYAQFLQFRKRIPEAISEYESMLAINPKNKQTWFQLIQIYMTDQNYDKLLEVTDNAIKNMPEVPQWYFYKAITQTQQNNYQGALTSSNEALKVCTDSDNMLKSDIYAQIGDIYYKLNNKPQTYAAYEKALEANPDNIFVMNNYAYFLSEDNTDLKKAEKMSAKTVDKEPKNCTYLDTYAWIFYKQGNYTLAKFYIERAMDNITPEQDPGVVIEHYGDILWQNGDKDKALEMWKKSYDAGNKTDELKEKIDTKTLK